VVLSGAQVPITRTGSDAAANLSGAVICAGEPLLHEVAIFFGGFLLRGNRARKWSSSARNAFCSPRWPPLAWLVRDTVKVDNSALLRPRPLHRAVARTDFFLPVGSLKIYPGISPELVELAGVVNIGGLVVEMYGAGTGPARDTELLHVIGRLTNRGTPVVGVSQCFNGELTPVLYATSRAFSEAGLINGRDLTPEAALAKLVYLRCLEVPASEMASLMAEDIAGEISSGSTVA
jgi:L-asparaginase/Glu-tRNA(Gln) amidotransferase subunit D